MQEDFLVDNGDDDSNDDASCVVINNGDKETEELVGEGSCEVFLPDATSTSDDEQDAASGEDINSGDGCKSTDSLSNSSINDEHV